MLQLRFETILE